VTKKINLRIQIQIGKLYKVERNGTLTSWRLFSTSTLSGQHGLQKNELPSTRSLLTRASPP